MPKIFLKPNSPEFAEKKKKRRTQYCEMPGCMDIAEHKAPKDRGLNEYYHFCFEHIKEYNKAWNFFSGMSDKEVQDHMVNSMYGDRPTWRYDSEGAAEDILRKTAQDFYSGGSTREDQEKKHKERRERSFEHDQTTPEHEAMAIMGLAPPLSLESIRKRYKKLAKKHHPDLNQGCKKSENLLKEINMAYTILKMAYEKFETLPDRD